MRSLGRALRVIGWALPVEPWKSECSRSTEPGFRVRTLLESSADSETTMAPRARRELGRELGSAMRELHSATRA